MTYKKPTPRPRLAKSVKALVCAVYFLSKCLETPNLQLQGGSKHLSEETKGNKQIYTFPLYHGSIILQNRRETCITCMSIYQFYIMCHVSCVYKGMCFFFMGVHVPLSWFSQWYSPRAHNLFLVVISSSNTSYY